MKWGTRDALGVGVEELGGAPGDEDVAGEGDLEPGGDGEPGDGADDGLAAELHLRDGVGGDVLHVTLEHLLRRRQVHPGAEGAAAAREHDRRDGVVGAQPPERGRQGDHHGPRQRVQRRGPVDGHHGDRGPRPRRLHQDEVAGVRRCGAHRV